MSSSPHEWYLRIEAVNLDYSVFDTNDISTIRGGSSLLLGAVREITHTNSFKKALIPVSVGASTGLYRINAHSDERKRIEDEVKNYLQGEPYCHFATFVVATAGRRQGESIADLNKRLMNECAIQQYQTPSFSFPAYTETDAECGLSGARPWCKPLTIKDKKISRAVHTRWEQGRSFRNSLYNQCFDGDAPGIEFTNDLNKLAQNEDIAVIHFDGNRFGSIRDHCFDEVDYRNFDKKVQGIQQKALKAIIDYAIETEPEKPSDKPIQLRLETLLWGGDEIELVVPASRAWATLKRFFEEASKSSFQTNAGNRLNLTYSAGVVFCRHNLPILQVRRYADQLCSIAKQQLSGKPEAFTSNKDNRFTYLNMSSFDIIERDVESFIASYHAPATVRDFTFSMDKLETIHNAMLSITRSFPKNKVYDIVAALQGSRPADEEVERALKLVGSQARSGLEQAINQIVGERIERWLLIGDLWNLIGTQAL